MIKRMLFNYLAILVIILPTLMSQGCPYDKVINPVKLRTPPNTFVLSERLWGGEVLSIEVWKDDLVWKIKAEDRIPVSGFSVTVGVVPRGFVQIYPKPPAKFVPILSRNA